MGDFILVIAFFLYGANFYAEFVRYLSPKQIIFTQLTQVRFQIAEMV